MRGALWAGVLAMRGATLLHVAIGIYLFLFLRPSRAVTCQIGVIPINPKPSRPPPCGHLSRGVVFVVIAYTLIGELYHNVLSHAMAPGDEQRHGDRTPELLEKEPMMLSQASLRMANQLPSYCRKAHIKV